MLAWRKGFYGYVIALSAFLIYLLIAGSYYGLSVLTPLMAGELAWSATAFGAAFSIFALVSGFSAPFVGAFVVRFGPRLGMVIGSLMVSAAFALLSIITEIWHFYACMLLMGLGFSLSAMLPVQAVVGNWFVERRSLILGLVLTGAGVGGLLIAPLSSSLVSASGTWRTVWFVLAGLMLVPTLVAVLFIRNRPEELGQRVDGVADEAEVEPGSTTQEQPGRVFKTTYQWETRAAIKTKAFWFVALANGIMFFLLQAVTAHQVAYLGGEARMELSVAASALGLIAGVSIVGRLLAGWLADRVKPRVVMAGLLLFLALSLVILLAGRSLVSLYVYVVLFGVGYGGMIVLSPTLMLNYFGSKSFAAIQGLSMPIGVILGALSPVLVGGIKDVGGSYVPAFALTIAVAIVGASLAFLARPPVPPPGPATPLS